MDSGRGGVAAGISLVGVAVALLSLCAVAGASHGVQERISLGPAGGNGAVHASYRGASSGGSTAFFSTAEQLVASDTDGTLDLYQRSGGVTTIVSVGPQGICPLGTPPGCGADFDGASSDGSVVYFHTAEQLVAADTDTSVDIYKRTAGTTTIVSQGPNGGNSNGQDAFFTGTSQDGSKGWFISYEELVAGDPDTNRKDVFQHEGGVTTQISTGPQVGAQLGADFAAASQDGSKVFFYTDEAITPDDLDGTYRDVYERSGGTTTLVSTGPLGGSGAQAALHGGISSDGSHVYFGTSEQLVTGDTDGGYRDVYERFGGSTTWLSTSPTSTNGPYHADFRSSNSDGSVIFFSTDEALATADTDSGCLDGGGFPTRPCIDVYQRFSGVSTLLSTSPSSPNGAYHAGFGGSSTDGARVFFTTDEPLTAEDTDAVADVYERFGGTTTSLVSKGTINGNQPLMAGYLSANQPGTRVFFQTDEPLVSSDTDPAIDIYERSAPAGVPMSGSSAATTIVSAGPSGYNATLPGEFRFNSADGTKVFFDTVEPLIGSPLLGADTDSSQDTYLAYVGPTAFPRPGGATPLRVPLVVAYSACAAPNSEHIAPLDSPSCEPPVQESGQLTTVSTGKLTAFVKLDALKGNTSTPEDEADIRITSSVTDVRKRSDGSDYQGQVILSSSIRQTDRANGTLGTVAGTVEDLGFGVPVDCVATADPLLGSTCSVTTTADTLLPGFTKEGKFAVLSSPSFEILDAGPDGSVTPPSGTCPFSCGSGDEQTFLRQGLFLP